MTIGKLIKQYRRNKRLSQMELETSAGLCFGVLSRIENSRTNPSKETLLKIGTSLDLSNEELLLLFIAEFQTKVKAPKEDQKFLLHD